MDVFGIGLLTLALFAGFGTLIGVLFGFFGMGGSFLVTPALLVMGVDAKTAVGSGLAFVFGTSVIAALKHRDHGQIDYKLGGMFVVGMAGGEIVGHRLVVVLERLGLADVVVAVAYIALLASVGLFIFRDARTETDDTGGGLQERLQTIELWPMVEITGGTKVSLWLTLAIAAGIGVLAGFLGVGGGFLLMPAMLYVLGVPAAVAVGTDIFQITASGAFGAFLYAQSGAIDLSIVVPLLAGSGLGARVGSAATQLVDEDDIKGYFGLMLLLGATAVAARQIGNAFDIDVLVPVSMAIILGSALLVAGAVLLSSVEALRQRVEPTPVAD